MPMLRVVPGEESRQESERIFEGAEAVGELWWYFSV